MPARRSKKSSMPTPLAQAFFVWAWCNKRACNDPTYIKVRCRLCPPWVGSVRGWPWLARPATFCARLAPAPQAAGITWNVCLCVMLFALANFLKSLAAKLLSQHFYQ